MEGIDHVEGIDPELEELLQSLKYARYAAHIHGEPTLPSHGCCGAVPCCRRSNSRGVGQQIEEGLTVLV